MLWGGVAGGGLELRRLDGGRVRVAGAFPYNREAVLADGPGGRRIEVIAARAFRARIEAGEDIHLLAQHDFAQPLASRSAGTLELRDGDDALRFEAEIDAGTSWAQDFVAAHRAGLVKGLSPGFRVRPEGERIEARGGDVRRTITAAELFEISAVTRPAYEDAQIEARNWTPGDVAPDAGLVRALTRWRA
jgi:hypothetical protein